jgi:hypothetical protein
MNRARIVPYADRVRRRREYLQQIAAARSLEAIGFAVAAVAGSLAVFFGMLFLLVWVLSDYDLGPGVARTCAAVLAITGGTATVGAIAGRFGSRSARRVEFVPPVGEQIAALPDEEILVRGAARESVKPEELVRPAENGPTPPEELLRSRGRGEPSE